MKDVKKAEVRRVLLGDVERGPDGRLRPIPADGEFRIPVGIADGAFSARFFGVSRRVRIYETNETKSRVMDAAKNAMADIGRGLALDEQPDAAACLIRYILTRPAVLTFDYDENGVPTLTAWTGRWLTSWISLWRATRAFERRLPDSIKPIKTVKPVKAEKRKEKKEKKEKKKTKEPTEEIKENSKTEEPTEEIKEAVKRENV